MLTASMVLLSMIPFGYATWRRNREFNTIRNEIMSLTGGDDVGFTRERYRENRDSFVAYALPVFFILLNAFSSLPFAKNTDELTPLLLSVMGFYMLIAVVNHCFASKKETVIYLEDVLTESELTHLRDKREGLNYGYVLYFVGRNEKSYPIKKEYIKHLSKIPSIYARETNLQEYLSVLEDMKYSLPVPEYRNKKEELLKKLSELKKETDEAIDWTLIALGKKDAPEDEVKKRSESAIKLKGFLKKDEEEAKKLEMLPAPILELQQLVESSIDEDMKKEAQEALDLANQLFEKSKKRKEDFAKDFLRMKQKSTIDAALQEMQKL